MTIQELLQKKAALIEQADLIIAEAEEKGEFTEEKEAKVKDLQKQAESLNSLIKARHSVDESKKAFKSPAVIPDMHKDGYQDNAGFKSIGDFLHAVRFGDEKGRLKGQSMGDNSAGGYLVPEQFSTELLKLSASSSVVRPRATVIEAGDPPDATLNIPVLDYSANLFGGVTAAWIEEGALKPATEAKFGTIDLSPWELAAVIETTDKLLRNWSAAGTLFSNLLSSAIASITDLAFLKADGIKKPLGVLNAANTGANLVVRETTGSITYGDIVNMLANTKMDGETYTFVAHQSVKPALMKLQDAAGNFIFIQGNATAGVPSRLAGFEIQFTSKTFPLGTQGDLALVDFSKYLIKDGSGIFIDISNQPKFQENKTIIKAFLNVDGKPWVTAPIKLEDGVTEVSPYVILK